jgi:hypothetical protein
MSDELAFSRNVEILENILGAEHVLPEPVEPVETILQAILNKETYEGTANSRIETILIAICNGTECNITVPQCENEAILLNVLNKSIYEGPVTDNTIPKLLVLWSKQEADPERFKFPFAVPKDGTEISVEG